MPTRPGDSVLSLRTIAVNTIAHYSHLFESFGAVPQHLAEEVIQTVFDQDRITAEIMADFAESYPTTNLTLTHVRCVQSRPTYSSRKVNYLERQLRTLALIPSFVTKVDFTGCRDLVDEEMYHLNGFINVITLNMSSTSISDYGISHLTDPFSLRQSRGLLKLKALVIRNVEDITDASLKYIRLFPGLALIDLKGCSVDSDVATVVFKRMSFRPATLDDEYMAAVLLTTTPHPNMAPYLLQTSDIDEYRKLFWAVHSGIQVNRDSIRTLTPDIRPFRVSGLTYVKDSQAIVDIPRKRPANDSISGPLKLRNPAQKQSLEFLKSLF